MIKPFDFYFDFSSPYSYLAHKQIRKIEKENSVKINYKPILLGGLLNLAGIKANAFIPSKAKFMIRDCKLIAEKHQFDFKFNTYFPINSLNLMRGVLIAEKNKFLKLYVDKMFDAFWKDGLNLDDKFVNQKVLENLGLNTKIFYEQISNIEIKNELKERTNDAFNKEVFGAPTFIINNKLFWGQDRLEFVLNEAKK